MGESPQPLFKCICTQKEMLMDKALEDSIVWNIKVDHSKKYGMPKDTPTSSSASCGVPRLSDCSYYNVKPSTGDGLTRAQSAANKIMNGFDWASTPEGIDYWADVHDRLKKMARHLSGNP